METPAGNITLHTTLLFVNWNKNLLSSLNSNMFCSIPLPPWVLEEISKNPDIVYTDRSGRRNPEYLSLGCDSLPVLRGRTPIQVYSDFMRSFRDTFKDYLGDVVVVSLLYPYLVQYLFDWF